LRAKARLERLFPAILGAVASEYQANIRKVCQIAGSGRFVRKMDK